MKIVVATHNQGKLREFQNYLGGLGWEVISLASYPGAPDPVEDGDSFAANALIKARAIMEFTGLACLADDSGLVVDALDGAPGIYSARYAGENASDSDNNRKLIEDLRGVPADKRQAKFVSTIAYLAPSMDEAIYFIGECQGMIVDEAAGRGGFGYDPHFYLPEEGSTMAEISLDRKNQISHRAQALEKLKRHLCSVVEK